MTFVFWVVIKQMKNKKLVHLTSLNHGVKRCVFSGPHCPGFGLNVENYSVNLHIQSECGKFQTRKTLNTDTT